MISVDEAKAIITGALSPLGEEILPLKKAHGRTLAQPIIAKLTQPPFSASAMDGYAVRFEDVQTGATLKVIGVSSAGERFEGRVAGNEAVRIYTGAPVPEGADHIVIQEHVSRDGDVITVNETQKEKRHIRPAGGDFKDGEALLHAGETLSGPALVLAAAANHQSASVVRRPRVALIANGDELVMPGGNLSPDEIVCSIPFGLSPMIENWGGAPEFLGIAPDDPAAIKAVVEKALAYDLIVPIGGASVGDRDFMRKVFKDLGFQSLFEKVAVKPGKPAWFGQVEKSHVIGLPGNPASALATAILFLRPAINAMLGATSDHQEVSLPLAEPLGANGSRENYQRARIVKNDKGEDAVLPDSNQDSSLMQVFARADLLLRRLPDAPAAAKGDLVDCLKI